MDVPNYFVPHTQGQIGRRSARVLPHHRILFLYLDAEVDLINELFLGHLLSKD